MKLLPHQIKYASGYPDKGLLVHETGTGKSVCAAVWLRDGRDANAIVVCPKRIVKKWKETLTAWDTKATVLSKEDFKKSIAWAGPRKWSALVVDEADEFASPLFTKGRSQLSTALYTLVDKYDVPTLLLTATPIRSSPWNLHSLLCFLRRYKDWKEWRKRFFELLFPGSYGPTSRPYLVRPGWLPKEDWRENIRTELERNADIVLLKDCVADLPAVEEEIIKTKTTPFESKEWDAMRAFHEEYRHEQKGKEKVIMDIAGGYRKVLVVAYYVEQVEELAQRLKGERAVYMVHGGVKDQEDVLKKANAADECYLIVQAELGVGFDADTFSCVIFASMAYGVQKYVQMKGRVRRIHNLHPVKYYYLLGGRAGKAVYDSVMLGRDFVPSEWGK